MPNPYPRIGGLKSAAQLRDRLAELDLTLPVDDSILSAADGSPMARPATMTTAGRKLAIPNRWTIHPMEGWDGTDDGRPSDLGRRRWRNFGLSGAGLVWGGEAVAVQPSGRANPNQLCHTPSTADAFGELLAILHDAAAETGQPRPIVGLQLTHSGRFARLADGPAPRTAYRHPVLDARGVPPEAVLSDDEIDTLIGDYVAAARTAADAGFDFVDLKSCHGYLAHEFLSAYDRPGRFGGDFDGRTHFLRTLCREVRSACPSLAIGVRLSLFDAPPFHPDTAQANFGGANGKLGPGIPAAFPTPYPGFGCDRDDPLQLDLSEPIRLIETLRDESDVRLWNLTAGSPYYNPHLQRPAFYPPSDGYAPPEDPLAGCVRQIDACRQVHQQVDGIFTVGTAYTYFQQFLPHVAQAVVRDDWVDSVGLGRMVLSDWTLPADSLAGQAAPAKRVCRTFSDCTTAPRNGLRSGCYPLDPAYKGTEEAARLKAIKKG